MTKKEQLVASQKAFENFFSLCKYLLGEDAPMDMNEIPEDSPFYSNARELVKEMEVKWDCMSHEDSNALMLNLLSDYWCQIKPPEDYEAVLSISLKKK